LIDNSRAVVSNYFKVGGGKTFKKFFMSLQTLPFRQIYHFHSWCDVIQLFYMACKIKCLESQLGRGRDKGAKRWRVFRERENETSKSFD
jgi:hypothetical protein